MRPAPSSSSVPVASRTARRYRVFISYSHTDAKWARWLMRRIEGYRVPRRFQGRTAPIGPVERRIGPVFRDRDELPTSHDLGEAIRTVLRESATLVVICSPAAARSQWVADEIRYFKWVHGEQRVFAFIVAGEPKFVGAPGDCFPEPLRVEYDSAGHACGPAEIVAADARRTGDGRNAALIRLLAGLLGVGFDDLRQREMQRRNRRLTLVAAASLTGMALTLGLAAAAWQARNDARRHQGQAEDLVTFMLGDLWEQLERVGRIDVLEAAGRKSLAYFSSLQPGDLTDATLAQQAKALTQIGRTRIAETRYPEAAQAFATAYRRLEALAARYPSNGDMRFERGQAEYWIGYVHWRSGRIALAREWFTRYRDTGAGLVRLDPERAEWLGELAYGHHNLAVLELGAGNLDVARAGFGTAMEVLDRMLARTPGDFSLRFRKADTQSWLGTVAERGGHFDEALLRFAGHAAEISALVRDDPGTARWRVRLADALALHASMLRLVGRRAESLAQRQRARELIDALVAEDPKNRGWLRTSLHIRIKEAELLRADGNFTGAATLVDAAVARLEELAAANLKDADLAARLGSAYVLQAELRLQQGGDGAAELANRAVDVLEQLLREVQDHEVILMQGVEARVTAARVALYHGDDAAALRHARRAEEVLGNRAERSSHWRVLAGAAEVHALLGRPERSRALIHRLEQLGYQPLRPWPELRAPSPLSGIVNP